MLGRLQRKWKSLFILPPSSESWFVPSFFLSFFLSHSAPLSVDAALDIDIWCGKNSSSAEIAVNTAHTYLVTELMKANKSIRNILFIKMSILSNNLK